MKKIQQLAMLLAIAATGTAGLTACSSSNDEIQQEVNPNYNPQTNTVNTQFVFNVATANQTRMPSGIVQMDNNFRGMEGVHIMAYKNAANGQHIYDVSTSALATAFHDYDLGVLLKSGEISENNSRRVVELALPVGTNTLMFYGKAPKTNGSDEQGSIDYTVSTNATNTSFKLKSRLSDIQAFNESCDMLATIMTRIAQNGLHVESSTDGSNNNVDRDLRYDFWWPVTYKNVNETGVYEITNDKPQKLVDGNLVTLTGEELAAAVAVGTYTNANGTTYTHYTGVKEWYEYGDAYVKNNDTDPSNDVALKPLEEILASAFYTFTSINTAGGEIRAGSADAVLRLVHDLWTVTDKVKDAEPTGWQEHIAKLLAMRIATRFGTYFTRDGSANVSYLDVSEIKTNLAQYVKGKSGAYNHVTRINNFPAGLNLPFGAAQMTYDADTHTFGYQNYFQMGTHLGGTMTTPDKFTYPAELCYFGNSPIRVSDASHSTTDYPVSVAKWDADANWTADWTKNSIVTSNTRSVAMQKDVNYGTALLKTTVRYGAATLKDNNKAIHPTENDNDIEVNTDETGPTFQLTGIIVGGQCREVGWDYVYRNSSDNSYNYMVYDSYVTSGVMKKYTGIANTDKSAPNYTLLWDNWDASLDDNAQAPVYVALEFKNNGKDFWGKGNLVRANGTFYLIGKLDPSEKDASNNAKYTFPNRSQVNYNLPPYLADGSTREAVRVFMQDYMTTADFVIGSESLHNAYVTVPDLRSSQISLGLSVDLKWETGIEFNDIILGE
mgnify:CR=1 FL=1